MRHRTFQVTGLDGQRLSRREALKVSLLFAALPLAAACGSGAAPAVPAAKPTEAPKPAGAAAPAAAPTAAAPAAVPAAGARGAGGTLKMLMWQGPTIVNGHLSQGTKDYIAARICCEPLLTVMPDGSLRPILAAEVPSKENGGLGADGKTVTYKLKKDVK